MFIIHYIYAIRNKINNKYYIGLTNNYKRRKLRHFTDLRNNNHDSVKLQKSYNKYGKENFEFIILLEIDCDRDEINRLEQEYINKFDSFHSGYNMNEGGTQNNGFPSRFDENDVFNILSVCEFSNRCGKVLADIYDTTLTTICRIRNGHSHEDIKKKYDNLNYRNRIEIFHNFSEQYSVAEKKNISNKIESNRKIDENNAMKVLSIFEFHPKKRIYGTIAKKLNVHPDTIKNLKRGIMYKDYSDKFNRLSHMEKINLYKSGLEYFNLLYPHAEMHVEELFELLKTP